MLAPQNVDAAVQTHRGARRDLHARGERRRYHSVGTTGHHSKRSSGAQAWTLTLEDGTVAEAYQRLVDRLGAHMDGSPMMGAPLPPTGEASDGLSDSPIDEDVVRGLLTDRSPTAAAFVGTVVTLRKGRQTGPEIDPAVIDALIEDHRYPEGYRRRPSAAERAERDGQKSLFNE
jgi:hypothetical protein